MFPALTEPFVNSEKRMNVPAGRLVSEVSGFLEWLYLFQSILSPMSITADRVLR